MNYYNWQKTFSYDAPLSIVVAARGRGKTYGLRLQMVKDYLKDGSRFAVVVRYKAQIKGSGGVQYGFFDKLKLNNEFPSYRFKIEGVNAYISRVTTDEDEKPEWNLMGYFVSLSDMQRTKERTYSNVKRILFDEFSIDKRTSARYLPDEFGVFSNVLSSLIREESGKPTKARVYLLGNSCDLTNPYFAAFGINSEPREGFTWYNGKTVLVHYLKDSAFAESQRKTLVGRLLGSRSEASMIFDNEFLNLHNSLVDEKTPNAKFSFGVVYAGSHYGVWLDGSTGILYVNRKFPKSYNSDFTPVFAMTSADNDIDLSIAHRAEPYLKRFVREYYKNCVRYDSEGTYESFSHVLSLLGIR